MPFAMCGATDMDTKDENPYKVKSNGQEAAIAALAGHLA